MRKLVYERIYFIASRTSDGLSSFIIMVPLLLVVVEKGLSFLITTVLDFESIVEEGEFKGGGGTPVDSMEEESFITKVFPSIEGSKLDPADECDI